MEETGHEPSVNLEIMVDSIRPVSTHYFQCILLNLQESPLTLDTKQATKTEYAKIHYDDYHQK